MEERADERDQSECPTPKPRLDWSSLNSNESKRLTGPMSVEIWKDIAFKSDKYQVHASQAVSSYWNPRRLNSI